jgi:uncharacterized protein
VPENPKYPVTDYTATLSSNDIFSLKKKLADFEKKTTNQIAVLIIQSLKGDNLEDYSIRLADKWKIGQKGKDNGVILLVVKKDRQLRIEVGYGLEHLITDSKSGSIIRETIIPLFKKNKFFEGINNGIDDIIKTISPNYFQNKGAPKTNLNKPHWIVRYILFIGLSPFIVIIIICIIFFRKESVEIGKEYMGMRGWRTSQNFWQRVGAPSGGSSVESGAFGDGGGGFGGSGGGFGGGGASGSW